MAGSWTRAGNKHNKPEISCSVKNKEILRTPVSSPKHTLENHWKFVTKTMTSTFWKYYWLKYQFSSVIQSCLTLCDPIGCSMPGFPVHRQLPEFTQAHAHWVSDAIQPSHSLSPSSPPAFNLSQHWGLFLRSQFFTSGGQNNRVSASVLPVNIQDWFPLGWTGWISLQSKGFSKVFSNTTVQKHQFFSTQLSL